MKNTFCLATALYGSVALPFVIPRDCDFFRFSWALALLPKYELSSRPKRSEVEGPAVLPTSHRMHMEAPALPFDNPERSRGICSSADLPWKCFSTER
jgi:hypothetical protein